MLPLVTVAAIFRVGELANSDGEMGAGNVLWLKRPALGRSADIALGLVFTDCQGGGDRHGFHKGQAGDIPKLQTKVFVVAVLFCRLGRRVWGIYIYLSTLGYLSRCGIQIEKSKIQCQHSAHDHGPSRACLNDYLTQQF